ncbi:MAG TPA: hypothetical protein VL983_10120 [Terriglobales bacterium]|nr:hypothetical protein [Terriglobales bacterium]
MRKLAIFVSVLAFLVPGRPWVAAQSQPQAPANSAEQQAFLREFNDACSQTQDAMLLTKDELKDLVRRCDALVPRLTKLDDTQRKVYKRRLEQCRGLFAYVLDTKKDSDK